ncbi:MAG: O-antigen ligase family protein [Candidatus Omnitrophota bacterium]|nr:O-antigen ligase family protein [Candidatus Omnitrophota bacterium]
MTSLLIILMLIFTPIARGAVRPWAFMPVYILIIGLAAYLICSRKRVSFRRTPLDVPILAGLAIFLISIFNTRYIYGSLAEGVKFISLAALFYIVVNFITSREEIKKIINAILITAAIITAYGVFQYTGVFDKAWWDNPAFLSATYVNHNHFAGYIELAIPLCLGILLAEKDKDKKLFFLCLFLMLSSGFLLSMSRGGWLSLTTGMVFMGISMFRKGKSRIMFFILAGLLITASLFIFKIADSGVLFKRISSYRELDLSGRLEIWKGTLGIIKDNLLFGTGPGTFIYNFPKYRPAGLNMFVNYAHNDYMQAASEMGVFSMCVMIFAILAVIRKGIRTSGIAHTPFNTWISIGLTAGVLSVAIHGLADFNFYIPANALLFTVFSGLILNISSRNEAIPRIFELRPGVLLKSAVIAVSAILIIFLAGSLTADVYSTFSENAVSKDEIQKAERLARIAARICPFSHVYAYRLANIYAEQGKSVDALSEYKRALELNPLDSKSWMGLAEAYFRYSRNSLSGIKSAKMPYDYYKKALELDPFNTHYLKKFGAFLLNSKNPGMASDVYRKTSEIMPLSRVLSSLPLTFIEWRSYQDTADAAFSGQDIDKAMIFYQMSEKLGNGNEPAVLGQVRCWLKMSRVKNGMLKYKNSSNSMRAKAVLFSSMGEYYLSRGRIETAERFLNKSEASEPGNIDSLYLAYKILKKTNTHNLGKTAGRILKNNKIRFWAHPDIGNFKAVFAMKEDIYAAGKRTKELFLPPGVYGFDLKARGDPALGEWPRMAVSFNGKEVINTYVTSRKWSDYTGIFIVDYAVNKLEIRYDNDFCDREMDEDRNLYIGNLGLKNL